MFVKATYVWIDGAQPTRKMRAKMRIVYVADHAQAQISDFPLWNFDGSSTYQSSTDVSDLILKPVRIVPDPIQGDPHCLVMCEVFLQDGVTPHVTNTRAQLRQTLEKGANNFEAWFGFEQEYTLFQGRSPLGWPEGGYPAPQGPFYCGVGSDEVFGRDLTEHHAEACLQAGLMLFGTNAEVMPGQWEFQIGYRGVPGEGADALTVCDHLWLARWLLYRLGEDYGISATLHPKPVQGDWNGAGQHTNFSTAAMRDAATGMQTIQEAIELLRQRHHQHIAVYGHDLDKRLTGKHETAPLDQFSAGVGHRGVSIRIPIQVAHNGYGYLEDRRPGANADPYQIANVLLETICLKVGQESKA